MADTGARVHVEPRSQARMISRPNDCACRYPGGQTHLYEFRQYRLRRFVCARNTDSNVAGCQRKTGSMVSQRAAEPSQPGRGRGGRAGGYIAVELTRRSAGHCCLLESRSAGSRLHMHTQTRRSHRGSCTRKEGDALPCIQNRMCVARTATSPETRILF